VTTPPDPSLRTTSPEEVQGAPGDNADNADYALNATSKAHHGR
jgi:hypothetical protein